MKKIYSAYLLGLFGLSSAAAFANGPSLSEIYVGKNSQTNGTGCPGSTAGVELTDDYMLHIDYGVLSAAAGQGANISERRKACVAIIEINAPAGWQYAIDQVVYRGEAELDQGTSVIVNTDYYTQGNAANRVTFNSTISGYYSGGFEISDYSNKTVWSPCGSERALIVNTEIIAQARGSKVAQISMDSFNTAGAQTFGLKWQRCF